MRQDIFKYVEGLFCRTALFVDVGAEKLSCKGYFRMSINDEAKVLSFTLICNNQASHMNYYHL